MTESDLHDASNATWRRLIEFLFSKVCKHYAVGILLDELERRGADLNVDLVKSVVRAGDDTALQQSDYRKL